MVRWAWSISSNVLIKYSYMYSIHIVNNFCWLDLLLFNLDYCAVEKSRLPRHAWIWQFPTFAAGPCWWWTGDSPLSFPNASLHRHWTWRKPGKCWYKGKVLTDRKDVHSSKFIKIERQPHLRRHLSLTEYRDQDPTCSWTVINVTFFTLLSVELLAH